MWGRRRSADDGSGARPAGIPEGAATEGALRRRASQAIAEVQLTPARDSAPAAGSATALNGTDGRGLAARREETQSPRSASEQGAADTALQFQAEAEQAERPAIAGATQALPGPTPEEMRFAVTFTRIVSILSRSPHYKHYALSDLEWLVMPPILTGQCAIMEARIGGKPAPVAVALWASVSEDVDKRLSANLTMPYRLRPDEWRSGEVLWLIDAIGEPKAVYHLLSQVRETSFTDSKSAYHWT